jgi:SAM-dependent methyltransferase
LSGAEATPFYFERFLTIEAVHFWFALRRQVMARVLARLVAGRAPGYRVLEVGCGIGGMLEAMRQVCAGGRVVGLDLALAGAFLTRARTRLPALQADVAQPPFGVEFDVICMFDVLEHIADDELVLRRLRDLLARRGALVLTVPASPSLWSYYDDAVGHHRRYRKAELAAKLTAAGFEIDYLSPYMIALWPIIYLKRWWSGLATHRRRRTADELHELALADLTPLHPAVNRLGTLLLAAEPGLIARRHQLPFGSSLLAIAQKI